MKEKFLETKAGEKWMSFQLSPTLERAGELVKAMNELDKSRADKTKEIEM